MSGNLKAGRIQTGFNHCLHHIFARIVVLLLGGLAVLLPASSARAAIALVDTETNNSAFTTTLLLATNLTVSASANTLVVVVTWRNAASLTEAPPMLNWTNATTTNTLNLIVQLASKSSGGRASAIDYLYNPAAGTGFNISGGLGSGSSGVLVAYTLSGVNTTVGAPLSSSTSMTGSGATSLSFTINGITNASWAAVGGTVATTTNSTINATTSGEATGSPVLTTTNGIFSGHATSTAMGYLSTIAGGSDLFTYQFLSPSLSDASFSAVVFAPQPGPQAIHITAASASPNPVLVGSPVLLSVTAASTAGSITSVVVNASAIGGSSALPLNLSAGNVYTNSVTTSIPSASASLPVTVQDSANNVQAGSIPVIVETTNVVESGLLRLVVYPNPFSFMVIEKATGTVLLQQTTNQFTIGSTYGVSQATNIVITSTTLDAELVLAGTSATGHITFNFIQPGMIQTTLSSSNSSPSQIFQQFADQGEDIFGGFECPTGGTLSTRNFSSKFAQNLGVSGIVNFDSAKAPFYLDRSEEH